MGKPLVFPYGNLKVEKPASVWPFKFVVFLDYNIIFSEEMLVHLYLKLQVLRL